MTPQEALKTYFGYDSFRPLQEDIIQSVLAGRDTLALMATGGGKSLCFQIPSLVFGDLDEERRLCLVVTPLIALMKDQVENLRQRDIRAAAIYSGMSNEAQKIALDNCQFGPYSFLYVSPERLASARFRERLVELPVGMIAVDEAHCISQWGYDFRPPYLHIGEIRQLLSARRGGMELPILALTATATPEVVKDIQYRLGFRDEHVLRKSYHRENLQYVVRHTDDKSAQLLHIIQRVAGTGIVYVRNRKRAQELAEFLVASGITADYYHAGLSSGERNAKQEAWKQNRTRIIVATNAFGMGIDKADVRMVIHHDLPDSLEAYYQEAGRAGRDGLTAFAILLYNEQDKQKARRRVVDNYPPREFVENVYHKTCDFFQIGLGSGLGHSFALHIDELCRVMRLPVIQTYSALQLLSNAGYIHFEEEHETSPRVRINVAPHMLADYDLNMLQRQMLNDLMRRYTGVFTDLQYLDTHRSRSKQEEEETHQVLASLAARGIVTYIPRTIACSFTLTREREAEIWLPQNVYDQRQEHYANLLKAMVEYAEQTQFCREQVLLSYFGETDAKDCGHCDVCRDKLKIERI